MNVVVVKTPHQLLNAVEAVQRFELVDNELLILLSLYPREAFAPVLKQTRWRTVRYCTVPPEVDVSSFRWPGNRIANLVEGLQLAAHQNRLRRGLDRVAEELGPVDSLVLGAYRRGQEYMRHLANVIPHKVLILLDDGTDTLIVEEERRELHHGVTPISAPCGARFGRLGADVRRRIEGWQCAQPPCVTFFTTYDLDALNGDRVVKNDYRHLLARVTPTVPSYEVLFLGQPLAEDGWMNPETYLEYLRRVRSWFGDERMIYIPHPRESKCMTGRIDAEIDLPTCRLGVPIESHLVECGRRPTAVVSLFSSALETCATIFGSAFPIMAFELDSRDLGRNSAFVKRVYEHFRSRRSSVIQVVSKILPHESTV